MATFELAVEHNDVANNGMTHFPQLKSICIDVFELVLLLLDRILHIAIFYRARFRSEKSG